MVNRQKSLFTIHTRMKKIYFAYSIVDEKWLIIVKFNYYEPFISSVGNVRTCISTVSYSITVNRQQIWSIVPFRGIRQ
jgi:hypothetical protein